MPRRGRIRVESHGYVRGLLIADNFEQCLRETVKRGGVDPFGRENGLGDQRKVRPINQGHAIQQEQLLRHGKTIQRLLPVRNAEFEGRFE